MHACLSRNVLSKAVVARARVFLKKCFVQSCPMHACLSKSVCPKAAGSSRVSRDVFAPAWSSLVVHVLFPTNHSAMHPNTLKVQIDHCGNTGVVGHLGGSGGLMTKIVEVDTETRLSLNQMEKIVGVPKPVFRWRIGEDWTGGLKRYQDSVEAYERMFIKKMADNNEALLLNRYFKDINYVHRAYGIPEVEWVSFIAPPLAPTPKPYEWTLLKAYKEKLANGITSGISPPVSVPVDQSVYMHDVPSTPMSGKLSESSPLE